MKKVLMLISAGVLLFANQKILKKEEVYKILRSSALFPQIQDQIRKGLIKEIQGVEEDGIYVIHLKSARGSGNIYITKDKKFTIIGKVINNEKNRIIEPVFPKDKQTIKTIKEGVLFTYGNGKKDIYLITDPECPYCRLLESKKGDVLKNYKVHVILMPLPFHKNAKAMSYYILAGKTDAEKAKRLQEVLKGSEKWREFKPTPIQKEQFEKELQKSIQAAHAAGARGTPTVLDGNFNEIRWDRLK